ncbi:MULTISPECIES: helix-turn-helix domain-containing protein [Chryseobacterium]|uniref:helix-turn-helix domain-containing protein n=1 Tax=Chryseobacterium TaxID=59732 RepID=UPI0022764E8D|nr:helix-turn-helix domain-containing protein [Chryseobacterium sp. SL1]MCY1662908.1 helix-turn-helix domain-containing protein [Chryseobacterium sp. SL1]
MTRPAFKKIYQDMIEMKYPKQKNEKCMSILQKKRLSVLDIIELNKLIIGYNNEEVNSFNQKHRSYDVDTILEILRYQRENNLNNTQLANYFKLSRNTVSKWKKYYFK